MSAFESSLSQDLLNPDEGNQGRVYDSQSTEISEMSIDLEEMPSGTFLESHVEKSSGRGKKGEGGERSVVAVGVDHVFGTRMLRVAETQETQDSSSLECKKDCMGVEVAEDAMEVDSMASQAPETESHEEGGGEEDEKFDRFEGGEGFEESGVEGGGVERGLIRLQETVRKAYSTTSSVYAEHTISNPNAGQILFWYVQHTSPP